MHVIITDTKCIIIIIKKMIAFSSSVEHGIFLRCMYHAVQCGYNFQVWVFNVLLVQMKALEKYFLVHCIILLQKVVLTLKFVDDTRLKC